METLPLLQTLRKRAILEGDFWLSEKLEVHIRDEKRHAKILTQALKHHGKKLIDLLPRKFQEKQPKAFFDAYFAGYSQEQLKAENINWLVFLGNAYILELDAHKDFTQLSKVLPEDDFPSRALKRGLFTIAQDEKRHAAYLYEAMQRKLKPFQVESLVNEWRKRKVSAIWSAITDLIINHQEPATLVQDIN
jgi:rubrerythrin